MCYPLHQCILLEIETHFFNLANISCDFEKELDMKRKRETKPFTEHYMYHAFYKKMCFELHVLIN